MIYVKNTQYLYKLNWWNEIISFYLYFYQLNFLDIFPIREKKLTIGTL